MEKVFDEPTSFIFSDVKNTDVDIYIQAPNFKIKEEWTHQINSLLNNQHDFLSCKWEELNAVFVDVFYVLGAGGTRPKIIKLLQTYFLFIRLQLQIKRVIKV